MMAASKPTSWLSGPSHIVSHINRSEKTSFSSLTLSDFHVSSISHLLFLFFHLCKMRDSVIDATASTAKSLQRAVFGLTLIFAVSVFFAPPYGWPTWVAFGLYLLILVGGMRGATKRSVCWLRFYWISQFLLLVLTLVSILFGLTILIKQMQWNREHPKEASEMYPEMKNLSKEQVTRFIIANVLYLISFLIVLAIKVRSILLAQRLTQEIQLAEAMTGDEFELEEGTNGSETPSIYETHTEELKTFEPTVAAQPVFMMAPPTSAGNIPFMAVPQFANGQQFQYVPVYVDQYGNPVAIHSNN
eukprot:TRINITY_DN8227_c0_g1_i1.p1 TRINITY_DN8227_c0_g1~~TRINITY_DN8227_c0_g1_i1.p1  ORF type:complete len:302 (+),score=83.85 TRINITY_DN8227_c0_g1_i1:58-963(+)